MKKGIATGGLIMWVATGSVGLLATIALAFASGTSTKQAELSDKVATNSATIGQLHTSSCVQNENMKNLAVALKVPFVTDPNCSK